MQRIVIVFSSTFLNYIFQKRSVMSRHRGLVVYGCRLPYFQLRSQTRTNYVTCITSEKIFVSSLISGSLYCPPAISTPFSQESTAYPRGTSVSAGAHSCHWLSVSLNWSEVPYQRFYICLTLSSYSYVPLCSIPTMVI